MYRKRTTAAASGEYEGKFGMFLMRECNDIGESRAYELIAIYNGTKTVEGLREEWREQYRAKQARKAAAEGVQEFPDSTDSHTNQPLGATNSRNPPAAKPKVGRPAAPQTPEARLTALITKRLKTLTVAAGGPCASTFGAARGVEGGSAEG